MKITHGLLPGQVLQRNPKNKGGALVTGSSKNGTLEFRILKDGKALPRFKWSHAGEAERRQFTLFLDGIPCGGPYQVELRVRSKNKTVDQLVVSDVFVGDVWIAAGQSNMQGIGNMVDAPAPHPQVRAFYTRDEWDVAEEPLHYLAEAVDIFHNGYGDGPNRPPKSALARGKKAAEKGVGPAMAFALEMRKRTRVPQAIIACAHGGTSMAQWSPELRDQGGASLYGAMMRRYEKLGQKVAGVIWYQGESDANKDASKIYTKKMQELVQATRDDMGIPKLPWLIVQIGCHAAPDGKYWNSIQDQQRLLPESIKYLDVAPTVDLSLDDGIHISGVGQQVLGKRLARLASKMIFKTKGEKGSIYLKRVSVDYQAPKPGDPSSYVVELEYGNVKGKLQSQGLPSGFTMIGPNGKAFPSLYKTTLRGNKIYLETGQNVGLLIALAVSYGHDRFPYCNITDSDGMSLPVIQSVPIAGDAMPFLKSWKVVKASASATLKSLNWKTLSRLKFTKKAQADHFMVFPADITKERSGLYALKTTVHATKDVNARLSFGADGPFALWLNGKKIKQDPHATNPCLLDQYAMTLKLKKGANDIVVAFDTAKGLAWGITARFSDAKLKNVLRF